ncbi:hypothetical protein AU381_16790 [Sinorhizobium glycinis]|uniref:PLD phosphodiesterase domain-containing protein n=1 Tax=Sinorhizobium glycinis TaxID=1472378 RepID=A0A178XKT0_9HYPH|nr:hypothetical protein [Sinorhizobium glycinis]OAP35838.1 hypothetical protein AU381_16790 [Sinorhizobium glycinis]
MRYFDVFGESGFHSAFMTTYAFSAQAFEDVPFPKLRGAGCRNIAVLADRAMLNTSFRDYGAPRYAGALYHVAKISVDGAFHPKLTLFLGAEKGRLLIGSANLTALGLAGNKELVADIRFSADDGKYASLFGQAINYIRRYVPAEDPWLPEALGRAFRYSPWLGDAASTSTPVNQDLLLLADGPDRTILDQIEEATADDEIEQLVVMSPYWDAKLEGLARLRSIFGMPPTDLLIDKTTAQFPATELAGAIGIQLFDLKDESSARFVHAKLIVALGKKWDHVVAGSMNCSLPALLGPIVEWGNAELGIYKRVEKGAALQALKLDGYRQTPIDPGDVPQRITASDLRNEAHIIDGGLFELRGQNLRWRPPAHLPNRPLAVQLYDRDGAKIGDQIPIGASPRSSWELAVADTRPRTAEIFFADGGRSAPTVIVDLDALIVRTIPPHRGKKRRIADLIDETTYEDLFLLQAINELETLDLAEQPEQDPRHGTAHYPRNGSEERPAMRTMSYEAFVAARSRAKAEDQRQAALLSKRQDGCADLVSMCLNRLIGLVAADFSAEDEADLRRQEEVDLRYTEPSSDQEEERKKEAAANKAEGGATRQRVRATARKILDAIAAFEQRTRSLAGHRIKTTELVRLRTLLQIVLAYAQPAGGDSSDLHVLPIQGKSEDWPRLLGRLLNLHFKTMHALHILDVEADENEQQRVLEYLAVARYAAHAAVTGARLATSANPVLKPLAQLAKDVDSQVKAVIQFQANDMQVCTEINARLNERFAKKLGIAAVPLL